MPKVRQKDIVEALLDRHGQTYAEELKIHVEKNTPSALFQLLCMSLLFSARIGQDIAGTSMRNLSKAGWRTPEKMADSTWNQRRKVLNESGYGRYKEKTSTMLGDAAQKVLDDYDGDLRNLREAAGHDPSQERKLLKEFKGIGKTGTDIFFREAQVAWDELFPYIDDLAQKEADKLGLNPDPSQLKRMVPDERTAQFVDALVRTRLAKDEEAVLEAARG